MKTKENSNLRKNLLQYIEDIKIKYLVEKQTRKDIAEFYNVSPATLGRFLKENNIKSPVIKRNLQDLNTQQEILNKIQELLNNGESLTNALNIVGINYNNYQAFKNPGNKNNISESKISLLDTDFCYWLGLFISDGHMDNEKIYICQSNPSFLKKMQKIFEHKGNINRATNTENPCYKLVFTNEILRSLLTSYNIESNKKLNAPYIDCGKNEHHFIRGLFDGDGCIYYSYVSGKFKEKNISFSTGSELVKNGIVNFLNKYNIDHQVRTTTAVHTCYTINIEKFDDIIKFANIIYKDKKLAFLDRKYYNFIKFIQLYKMNCKVNEIVGSSSNIEE